MMTKPRLLILSAVYPFPRSAGQQQRVYYTLCALREEFHLTFLTIAPQGQIEYVREKLLELCDDAIILPSIYTHTSLVHIFHELVGSLYILWTGLKFSNYQTGELEFLTRRLARILDGRSFEGVLFEYWHAHKATAWFRERGIKSILDMHDILWRSYARQLDSKKYLPAVLKSWMVRRYQVREETAWNDFDILIAINQDELEYAQRHTRPGLEFFYVPMGTDISTWSYCWQPAVAPRRMAYYGSLGSRHNQQDALLCYREIMPVIWQKFPDVEFWIVGSNPPVFIKELEHDPRVHVTGYVEHPQEVLKSMSLVLCPWSGTYGFRSRVVEVMALGIPVVAYEDSVYGMGFEVEQGIILAKTSTGMASCALAWISNELELQHQSKMARKQIIEKFSFEATYLPLSKNLFISCINNRQY